MESIHSELTNQDKPDANLFVEKGSLSDLESGYGCEARRSGVLMVRGCDQLAGVASSIENSVSRNQSMISQATLHFPVRC